jgi:multidrug resistance efflux pump
MFRKYMLPVFAGAGFLFALWMVLQGGKPIPPSAPIAQPPQPPYVSKISGAGILEAGTRNIAVGTPVAGIVAQIHVSVSQHVQAGDPLFTIDEQREQALLMVRKAALIEAEASLQRLLEAPRKEELPAARARVKEAEANLRDLRFQLKTVASLTDRQALGPEELERRRFAVEAGEARLEQARAELSLLRAGAWDRDIDVARALAARAASELEAQKVEVERLTVRAPVEGDILQINIRPGEFAQTGSLLEPHILMGDLGRFHVRVEIDENDAWRFDPTAPAVAFVRGNPKIKTDLTFEYIEPYVIPKRSLTGESTERVDTRVMQVVYSFEPKGIKLYPGQLMDVYIEDRTSPSQESAATEKREIAP